MRSHCLHCCLVVGISAALALAKVAVAQSGNSVSITGATVDPAGLISPSSLIRINVMLNSGYSQIQIFRPTEVQIIDRSVTVDIYADSGLLNVPDSLVEAVPLGTLKRGTYDYHITQRGPTLDGLSTVSGSFLVVPEPSVFGLLLPDLAILLVFARRPFRLLRCWPRY
jgi:hypothetical protein